MFFFSIILDLIEYRLRFIGPVLLHWNFATIEGRRDKSPAVFWKSRHVYTKIWHENCLFYRNYVKQRHSPRCAYNTLENIIG